MQSVSKKKGGGRGRGAMTGKESYQTRCASIYKGTTASQEVRLKGIATMQRISICGKSFSGSPHQRKSCSTQARLN